MSDRRHLTGRASRGRTIAPAAAPRDRAEPRAGDVVVAQDGAVGRVERVVRTERGVPHHLVVSVGRLLRRHPVVSCELITRVDRARAVVRVRGPRGTISRLPEDLPLVI